MECGPSDRPTWFDKCMNVPVTVMKLLQLQPVDVINVENMSIMPLKFY